MRKLFYVFAVLLSLYSCTDEITPEVFSVTFQANGGTEVTAQNITNGELVAQPTAPVKEKNTFEGWYKNPELTTVFDFTKEIITANTVIYAKWKANPFTVTFMVDNQIVQTAPALNGLVSVTPTVSGKVIKSWYTDSALKNKYELTSVVTQDITLYAYYCMYFPKTKTELLKLINDNSIKDLNLIDTSAITDMNGLFNGVNNADRDISKWDVSNVTNMSAMFYLTPFNQDISQWDVSKVTDMSAMFIGASKFNQDISKWNVSKVKNMAIMFAAASSFNQDISQWDVSKVTNMSFMFNEAYSFNKNLSKWDVSSIITMVSMFDSASSFNQDLSSWKNKLKNDYCNVVAHQVMFRSSGIINASYTPFNDCKDKGF